MTTSAPNFDKAFLDRQRKKLISLRESLLQSKASQEALEAGVNAETAAESREYEDDAQKLTSLELQGNLVARSDARIVDVERALQKLDAGTYGRSESSGRQIPTDRPEAMPDALYTLEEQQARDSAT